MAPNNALGRPSAAKMRAAAEGTPSSRRSKSPVSSRKNSERSSDSVRVSSADGFGAGDTSVLDRSEVTGRGTGTAIRTPLEEFEARPRSELKNFLSGAMFLTRLPVPSWVDHHPGYLMRSMAYFPLLGALIGVWAAAIFDAAASLWPPLVAAALSSAGTLWLTGCFHEDGLCDTLDGFGGGWTKSQILRIMRDSRNGSYATMGGCMWVVAKCAALGQLGALAGPTGSVWALAESVGAGPAIVVAQCVARASAAPLIYFFEYIVDDEDAKGEYYNVSDHCGRQRAKGWSCTTALLAACAATGWLLPLLTALAAPGWPLLLPSVRVCCCPRLLLSSSAAVLAQTVLTVAFPPLRRSGLAIRDVCLACHVSSSLWAPQPRPPALPSLRPSLTASSRSMPSARSPPAATASRCLAV